MASGNEPATDPAEDCARHIAQAFVDYNAEFRSITRRAPLHFDKRDWKTSQRDAVERIELYDRFVNRTIFELRAKLGARIRPHFAAQIAGLPDEEFTKTFFSSITRRLFGTVGVAADMEFVATDLDPLAGITFVGGTKTYVNRGSLKLLIEDLLGDLRFRSAWRDLDKSVAHLASDISAHLGSLGG